MSSILFNTTGQLRRGWRIVVFLFVFFLFSTIFVIAEEILIGSLPIEPASAKTLYFVVNGAGLLALAILLGGASGRLFENLPFQTLGASFINGWFNHFALGVAIGAGALGFAVLIAFVFGGERFEVNVSNGISSLIFSLVISLVVFAIGAAWEEAFFRGYIFQTLTRSNLTWLALVLTSAFFGVVHLSNQSATWISTLNTILAGLWLVCVGSAFCVELDARGRFRHRSKRHDRLSTQFTVKRDRQRSDVAYRNDLRHRRWHCLYYRDRRVDGNSLLLAAESGSKLPNRR